MVIFDEHYRTFVHLAQKLLRICSDILHENPVCVLDFYISFVV